MSDGPHQSEELVTGGTPIGEARAAVVAVHGRGATARGVLDLAREVSPDGVASLAPQAAGNTWYPNSFLASLAANQPHLDSGLRAVGDAVDAAVDGGVPLDRVVLVGFSQGACLASEYVARNARRYGGVGVLSGGLIGPEGTPRDYEGSLDGTPVFLGCSDRDPHVPAERVHETRDVFERLDGDVTERLYEAMGHGVNEDELERLRGMVRSVVDGD
jgi:phospholipase/carboxylesterase